MRRRDLLLGLAAAPAAAPARFVDPLDTPALPSALAQRAPLVALARAGNRLVAAGVRGHILLSDDDGQQWRQASVPVSADLVALSFADEQHGWAVGHGGVLLASSDGGQTWQRRLAGKQALVMALAHYRASGAPAALLVRVQALVDEEGTQPLLDVHFETPERGFIVGSFNQILRSDDGGAHWAPWMERCDNPDELHFNAVRGAYLAGERGQVWRLDPATQRFAAVPTPYAGSLFGLLVQGEQVLAFGMRGAVFRSDDGARHWQRVSLTLPGGTASTAAVSAALALPDGRILLADQGGLLWTSRDAARSFTPSAQPAPMACTALALAANGQLVIAGAQGVRSQALE